MILRMFGPESMRVETFAKRGLGLRPTELVVLIALPPKTDIANTAAGRLDG